MKKRIYLLVLLLPTYLLMSYSSGAPFGYSGSPGDNNRTCTICHSSNGVSYTPTITISGLPESGYTPGETYQISLSVTGADNTNTGFEACVENANNQKKGTFNNTDGNTQTIQGDTYITHTSLSITSPSWQFEWTAPATSQGDLQLYYAVNLADGNYNTNNDYVESGSVSIPENTNALMELGDKDLSIYPNPTMDYLQIKSTKYDFNQAEITDMSGKTYPVNINNNRIDIRFLPTGKYFLRLKNEQINEVKQFIKK